jgi:RNA polymerase II elongation factor ELL
MAAPRHAAPLGAQRGRVRLPPHALPPPGAGNPDGVLFFKCRLTDDLVRQMQASTLTLATTASGTSGTIYAGSEEIGVKFRPLDAPSASLLISHRKEALVRACGALSGEADVVRSMTTGISSLTKKRTLEAEADRKKSTTLMMAAGDEPKAKRSRGSAAPRRAAATTVKRPRVRPSAAAPNGLTSVPAPRRMPASVLPTSTPSPHVSPPGLPSSAAHQASMARAAAALSGNGFRPPRSTPSAGPVISTSRASAVPSPAASRGPSPARVVASAPTSPRTGALPSPAVVAPSASPSAQRVKELKRHLAHLLALQNMSASDMKNRLGSICADFELVRKAAQAVGTLSAGSKYKLKPEKWAEVTSEYEHYSHPEREFIRRELANRAGGTATGSGSSQGSVVSPSTGDGSPGAAVAAGARKSAAAAGSRTTNGVSSFRAKITPVDPELDNFVTATVSGNAKTEQSIKPIGSDADDAAYRSSFNGLWKHYCALHGALTTMQSDMTAVRNRRNVASFGELPALNAEAARFVHAMKDRWEKYCEAYRRVHRELEVVKTRITEYSCGR